MCEYSACTHAYVSSVCSVPPEVRRGCWVPRNWSYTIVSCQMVLGREPKSSAKAPTKECLMCITQPVSQISVSSGNVRYLKRFHGECNFWIIKDNPKKSQIKNFISIHICAHNTNDTMKSKIRISIFNFKYTQSKTTEMLLYPLLLLILLLMEKNLGVVQWCFSQWQMTCVVVSMTRKISMCLKASCRPKWLCSQLRAVPSVNNYSQPHKDSNRWTQ